MTAQSKNVQDDYFKVDEDPRFAVCLKEAKISFIFYAAFVVFVMLAMYSLGSNLVLGFPLWFLMSGIVIPIVFICILYYITEKVFEDTPLEPVLEEKEDK
jgi:uncharacterized membrane protein YhdT